MSQSGDKLLDIEGCEEAAAEARSRLEEEICESRSRSFQEVVESGVARGHELSGSASPASDDVDLRMSIPTDDESQGMLKLITMKYL